jgi:hypothetical protein
VVFARGNHKMMDLFFILQKNTSQHTESEAGVEKRGKQAYNDKVKTCRFS